MKLSKRLQEVRAAVADYMASEGCSCCQDYGAHRAAHERLAKLLDVPAHPEQVDYFPFKAFETKP
jgi:methionine aminopeptidase